MNYWEIADFSDPTKQMWNMTSLCRIQNMTNAAFFKKKKSASDLFGKMNLKVKHYNYVLILIF